MLVTNHERICRAFILLRDGLREPAFTALAKIDGEQWERKMRDALGRDDTYYGAGGSANDLDVQALLWILHVRFQDCIGPIYRLGHGPRGYISELRELRNKWAHQVEFDNDAAARAIETAVLLLKALGSAQIEELNDLRSEILPRISTSSAARPIPGNANSGLVISDAPSKVQPEHVARVGKYLGTEFTRTRQSISTSRDGEFALCSSISKNHAKEVERSLVETYWYTIHERQLLSIADARLACLALVCGSANQILLIPVEEFIAWCDELPPSTKGEIGWHLHITNEYGIWALRRSGRGRPPVELTKYFIHDRPSLG